MTISAQALSEWRKLFPQQISEDSVSSATFIKRLTIVVISVITYLKNAFPRDNYIIESFEGRELLILNKKCRNGVAQFLVSALVDAFDALDKKYLHKLALCFYKDEYKLESLIECHTFEYVYKNDTVTMSLQCTKQDDSQQTMKHTFEDIRVQTMKLIKKYITLMDSCRNLLPLSYGVSLRLYYNEDVPAEYHAPGFISAAEQKDHLEYNTFQVLKVGSVNTPYHGLVTKSYINDQTNGNESPHNAAPLSDKSNQSGSNATSAPAAERVLVCPCNHYDNKDSYKTNELLTCYYCNTQQHAPCYGVLREEAPHVKEHCCANCHDADPSRRPTDLRIVKVAKEKRALLCMLRRALEYCAGHGKISARRLIDRFVVSRTIARALIRILCEFGVIQKEAQFDLNTSRDIVKDKLDTLFSKYFNKKEMGIVDRLVAEIEEHASQESRVTDLVADVLSQEERDSIHEASHLGRIVDRPGKRPADDDSTLKQYREALVPDEIEDSRPANEFVNIRDRNKKRPILGSLQNKRAKV